MGQVYNVDQVHDKASNLLRKYKSVTSGYTAQYGEPFDLTYSYDTGGHYLQTGATDALDLPYSCEINCDANANVLTVFEQDTGTGGGTLWQCFTYDSQNRLTAWKTFASLTAGGDKWTLREHEYDGIGRVLNSTYSEGTAAHSSTPCASMLSAAAPPIDPQHIYSSSGQHLQNTDGTNWGEFWRWAKNPNGGPMYGPQPDSAAGAYNVSQSGGAGNPQRATYSDPTTPGDKRLFWQQGHPQAKDGTGGGLDWDTGMVGQESTVVGAQPVNSRLFFEGTVEPDDMSRATDARQAGYIGIFGTNLNYAGSAGQVRNDDQGVSLNPGATVPAKAWAPGLEPPGWNDQLLQPCLAYPPGQEPPEQLGPGGLPRCKPMLAVGPGEPDPWADLPPFGMRPMVAYGPGQEDPYEDMPPGFIRPMGAGTGTSTDIAFLPGMEPPGWGEGNLHYLNATAPAKAYLPGTEPPGWGRDLHQLMGAGASTGAGLPPGGPGALPHPEPLPAYYVDPPPSQEQRKPHMGPELWHVHDNRNGTVSMTGPGFDYAPRGGGWSPPWAGMNFGAIGSGGGGSRGGGNVTAYLTVGNGHPDVPCGWGYEGMPTPATMGEGGTFGQYVGDFYGFNGWGGAMAALFHQAGAPSWVSAIARPFYNGIAAVTGVDPTSQSPLEFVLNGLFFVATLGTGGWEDDVLRMLKKPRGGFLRLGWGTADEAWAARLIEASHLETDLYHLGAWGATRAERNMLYAAVKEFGNVTMKHGNPGYSLRGWYGSKRGLWELGVNSKNEIYHRLFNPMKKRRWKWDEWL